MDLLKPADFRVQDLRQTLFLCCQYAAKPDNERTTGIDGFLFTVIIHTPLSIKWKIRFLSDCARLSKIPEYNPLLNWRSASTTVHDH
jgi:hypothetical protein